MSAKSRALGKLKRANIRAEVMVQALNRLGVKTGDSSRKIEALNKSILKIKIGENDGQD